MRITVVYQPSVWAMNMKIPTRANTTPGIGGSEERESEACMSISNTARRATAAIRYKKPTSVMMLGASHNG